MEPVAKRLKLTSPQLSDEADWLSDESDETSFLADAASSDESTEDELAPDQVEPSEFLDGGVDEDEEDAAPDHVELSEVLDVGFYGDSEDEVSRQWWVAGPVGPLSFLMLVDESLSVDLRDFLFEFS